MICRDFTILLTGHSLGGALATLAAYDIRRELNVPRCSIVCYTFGAPRVGNYTFAHDYNQMVPNTWNIINDQVKFTDPEGIRMSLIAGLYYENYEIAGAVQAARTESDCQQSRRHVGSAILHRDEPFSQDRSSKYSASFSWKLRKGFLGDRTDTVFRRQHRRGLRRHA